MDLREELMIKILATLQNNYDIDVTEARNKLVFILDDYNIDKVCTALVANDIHEKLHLFLAVKKFEGLATGSLQNYRNTLVDFSRYIFKPVAQVDTMDIRKYLAVNYDKVKPTTLNTKASKIRAFFEWLHNEGYIENDPSKGIAHIKTESRVRKGLTLEQLEIMRTHCITKRESALLEFLYTTGCRVSEAVEVDISDIDWNEMSLFVIGKGNKEREVCFDERAKVILKDYLASRSDDCTALFVTTRAPSRLGRNSMLREISRIGKRMSPPIRTYPHLLRHTFATHAINAGIPIEVVQEFLGHESPVTTVVYAKVSKARMKQEYKKF